VIDRGRLASLREDEEAWVGAELCRRFGLPFWQLCRAEYWFCPPPRDGAAAAAAVDEELERFLHLWCLNRGVLLTPFHNMALFCPAHTESDVDRHTEVFTDALDALLPLGR
jgi:glutamate-1-semialdehyde 2,1-aminomutase